MLLLIESSTIVCSVALASGGKIIALREIAEANRHAEKLTLFCEELVNETGIALATLDAVAVSGGPGSYTGLRIGVSAAKGICYALGKPLISVGTLEAMAHGMKNEAQPGDLLCPMIDARRMEVYCALFDHEARQTGEVKPLVLDENSFAEKLAEKRILFSGDGMPKSRALLSRFPNAVFTESGMPSSVHLLPVAEAKLAAKAFEDVAYFEPFYLKTFHPGPQRSKAE